MTSPDVDLAGALVWAIDRINPDEETVTVTRGEIVALMEEYGDAWRDMSRWNRLYMVARDSGDTELANLYADRYAVVNDAATAAIRKARTL